MAIKRAIFFFTYLLIGPDVIRGQDLVTDEDANRIFNSLENFGSKNKKKDKAIQYVVLFAANKDELHQLDLITQRSKIFENNDTGEKLHGELVILDQDEISKMSRDIGRQENTLFIFLYSTYIPCASVGGKRFSCAEEVGAYAAVHNLRNRIFVGYNTTYNKTNKNVAEQFLSNGGVIVYEKQAEVYMKSTLPPAEQFVARLLQPLFLECLMEWITCNVVGIPTLVNELVRSCLNINTGGRILTLRSRYFLFDCLGNKFRTDGPKDLEGSKTELAVDFCIVKSLDKSNAIGKPTESRLDCSWWNQDMGNSFKDLYEGLQSETGLAFSCEIKSDKSITKENFEVMKINSDCREFVESRTSHIFAKRKKNTQAQTQNNKKQRPMTRQRTRSSNQDIGGSRERLFSDNKNKSKR